MREYDVVRVIGATVLAAGVAVMSQDPSFRMVMGPAETEATVPGSSYRDLMTILKYDPAGDKSEQFKGDVKKTWVRFTDEDLLEMDGNYDRFLSKIQERYEDRQEEIMQWVADWYKSARS